MRRDPADDRRLADARARRDERRRRRLFAVSDASPTKPSCCCSRSRPTRQRRGIGGALLDQFIDQAQRERRQPGPSRSPRRQSGGRHVSGRGLQAGRPAPQLLSRHRRPPIRRADIRSRTVSLTIDGNLVCVYCAVTSRERSASSAEWRAAQASAQLEEYHNGSIMKMPKTRYSTLTADIVAAHVSNNSVAVNDLPNLIQNVHGALIAIVRQPLGARSPAGAEGSDPLVDQAGLHRLPRGREATEDAQAASDDALST